MTNRPAPRHVVKVSANIEADPALVYSIIADYRDGHPHILPKAFSDLVVERGGTGAGTVIRFNVRVLGQTRAYRAAVTEPMPGRVLVERNVSGPPSVTTFTVDPGPGGQGATVTIATELATRSGLLGVVERALSMRVLRPLYEGELVLLAAFARARQRPSSGSVATE